MRVVAFKTEQVCFQFLAKKVTLSIVRSSVGRLFHKLVPKMA